MLFNSLEFIVFFPIVTLLYFLVPDKLKWAHLLLASCIFYAAFIPIYLLILFILIIIDYWTGLQIEDSPHKKRWLIMSIASNLLLLGIFKYYNFFITNVNEATGADFILLHIALPIGLSFHTFQSMSYTIEVYKGRQKAIRHIGYYSLYVMFYPQLVAGPIERPQNLFPQFFNPTKFNYHNFSAGIRLMVWGMFKKVVIADRLGLYADDIFKSPQNAPTQVLIMGILAFTFQIYADFSGYSDIAIGAAKTMNIQLMENFKRPYFSKNVAEFWHRWHISLSTWFRDYLYIPLGGNQKGKFRTKLNIMITFLLSGFWHGANWTFIIWGGLHGIFTIFSRNTSKHRNVIVQGVQMLGTFTFVAIAWVFFRANTVSDTFYILKRIMGIGQAQPGADEVQFGSFSWGIGMAFVAYMLLVEALTTPKMYDLNDRPTWDVLITSTALVAIIFFGIFNKSNFIYFQF